MTYTNCATILAASMLLVVPLGCDNDKESSEEDAGPDVTEVERTDTAGGADDSPGPDAGERPSARAGESGTIDEKPPLPIEELLPVDLVQEMTESSELARAPIPGINPSPDYNAVRLHSREEDGYGVGLQVWRLEEPKAARSHFEKLRGQYLEPSESEELVDELERPVFTSTRSDVANIVTWLEEPPVVVAISCATDTCDSSKSMAELARAVLDRLQ